MNHSLKAAVAGAALFGGLMAAVPVTAAPLFTFVPNGASPSAGYTVIDNFNTTAGLTGTNFVVQTGSNAAGTPPQNSVPFGTSYLAVAAGGSATYTFASPTGTFQFDWGSIDDYNTLTTKTASGQTFTVTGSQAVGAAANGTLSGLFTVSGNNNERYSSVTFSSSQNSFEADNLATAAVPEPAVWMMMLAGFGFIGAAIRRRRTNVAVSFV